MRRFATAATLILAGSAVLTLAGCEHGTGPAMGAQMPRAAQAVATLRTPDGADIGRATATEVTGGLRITLDAHGLTPGLHGAHVHTIGHCDAPDFMTAGGHWNPTGMKHGSMNPSGPHEGDLPNLVIGVDGRGTIGLVVPGATIAGLLDADGSALVIHAKPDDLMTDPSGNSGARIACGVFGAN